MKVILATWQALCLVGNASMYVAAFFLWSAIAAGAGWMLMHLPDVWFLHLENQLGTNFAVAACHGSAYWSHSGIGVMEPPDDRRNRASAGSA
jgi:hypothetical protein